MKRTRAWAGLSLILVWLGACRDGAGSEPDASPELEIKHLTTSVTHSCAIREAGLYCWGSNARGELGDETTSDSKVPVLAKVAGDSVVEVAVHSGRTCVRSQEGDVACWGANEHGQIGDGTRDDSLVPVAPMGISEAHQLAVDDNSTCVVHGAERKVSCWGESSELAPDKGSLVPEVMEGVAGVQQLKVGAFGSYCALVGDGSVLCWHAEDGRWTTPASAAALSGVRAIAMPNNNFVCAAPSSGNIICQGVTQDWQQYRVELPSSSGSQTIEAGSGGLVVCAADAAGAWQCWNVPSFLIPMLGVEDVAGRFPVTIESDMPLRELAIAGFRLCVMREDYSVACVDDASESSAAMLAAMRIEISSPVMSLPD